MTATFDLAVIGAGPAGMSAAVEARRHGLDVVLLDEQASPGGQIWRGIEAMSAARRQRILGGDHDIATSLVERFRASGATYRPQTQVWQGERDGDGWLLFVTRGHESSAVQARHVLIAVGAMERPVPFRGWTLPGVLTVGAAQIALKESDLVPKAPVVIAGQGPLPLLYATQMLAAGARPDAILLTTPGGAWRRGAAHLPGALANWPYLLKGAAMLAKLKAARVPIISGVTDIAADGRDRVEAVEYVAHGRKQRRALATLLVHDGVVPQAHMAMSLGAAQQWDAMQWCYRPVLDALGGTSLPGLSVAGDAAGISGALAAIASGARAAVGVALALGRTTGGAASVRVAEHDAEARRHTRVRPFLDVIYTPRSIAHAIADDVVVCRCEETTAAGIRAAVADGCIGPAQVKSFTRAGMGPCQGRQCALSIAILIAEARKVPVASVNPPRFRPPLKPVTLGELAALAETMPQRDQPP